MCKKILICFLFLISLGGLAGCTASTAKEKSFKILVTIPPYADFVKTLVGHHASVEIFVPPGASPHTYEPTPEQIQHFTEAKVWFRIGDPIEQKMVPFLQQRQVEIINLSEEWATLDLGEQGHEEKDLHLWMNPQIAIEQVEAMAIILVKLFPEISQDLKENQQKLIDRLKKVDQETGSKLAPFQGRYLLVSHPALGYFCQRYGLYQLSIEVEGKDPLPQDIASLMHELKSHPVPVVFIEPQYNNKGALIIADKLHLPFEEINPYAEDYFSMLNHLTQLIVKYYDHSNS